MQKQIDLKTNNSEYVIFQLMADRSEKQPRMGSSGLADANVPAAAQKEFHLAETALGTGNRQGMEEGSRNVERGVSMYPRLVKAHLRLGTGWMDLGQWDKAEQALQKTVEVDPRAANAYFALGEIYLRQKKYEQAEKALQSGLAVETRSASAHLTLARVYWDRVAGLKEENQWRPSLEKSYQEVKQALELDPNLAGAHLLKGNLYFKVRRAADALHEYEEYLRLDPHGQFAGSTRTLVEKIRKALAEQKP